MQSQMATPTRISLKLLVNKNSKKVLFAEAGKDFVDFLFGLLEMPIGYIANLLMEHGVDGPGSSGSLGKLYQSVKKMDCSYLQGGQQSKDSIFNPMPAFSSKATRTFLQPEPTFSGHSLPMFSFGNPNTTVGYVKDVVSYMVMDDLEVKPMSTISSITLLNTFDVKDIGCLEERTVKIDMAKGLKLVRASFESTTVLTDVFLSNKVISG